MASFQFKPNARTFIPRGTPDMSYYPATPAVTNGGSNVKLCQALLQYNTCLCRTPVPTWACNQPQCPHDNPSLVVTSLPFACCSPTNVGARAVNKKQRPSSQEAEKKCRTEACRATDPANQQYVSDADAAQALQRKQLVTLDAFPGLSTKNFDEVVPAFLEEGKSWPEEVRARYQALRTSLDIKDEKEEKDAAATDPSATISSNQSDSEDSDETLENSDSDTDSDPGVNSDDDDDEAITTPTDPVKLKFLAGIFAPIARPTSSAAITSTSSYESDSDSDYDSDDEEEDEQAGKKKNKYSLRSLVEESEPSL